MRLITKLNKTTICNLNLKLKNFFKIIKNQNNIYQEFFLMRVGSTKTIIFDYRKANQINLAYLVYKGFKIVNIENIDKNIKKITIKRVLATLKEDKKYSWLIKLPRSGKNGKRIYVYKLRTMYPYSEYLQTEIIRMNGLNDDGTIKDDFRITKFGKFARKFWLDELPMLLNFIKGDLKIIGIRPLSDSMLSLYPKDFVNFRNQFKPGLIPPYYIDCPKNFNELIESEKKYLLKYKKNPLLTDLTYFIKFIDRVLFKGVRSS